MNLMFIGPCIIAIVDEWKTNLISLYFRPQHASITNYKPWLKNERPTWCHLLFYFTFYLLNMFRTLIYPSSGACDCVDELPHRSSCSQFVVFWRFGAAGFEWCSFCRLQPAKSFNRRMLVCGDWIACAECEAGDRTYPPVHPLDSLYC